MLTALTADEIERNIWLRMAGEGIALTDLTPISVARILVRQAICETQARLWAALGIAQDQWYMDAATGADLDRRLADFGYTRSPATAATSNITVTATGAGATILQGAVAKTTPADQSLTSVKRYSVLPNPDTADHSWTVAASSSAEIPIQASEAGEAGNTAAGTILAFENTITGVDSVENLVAVINGTDAATDDEARAGFQSWLQSLSGATRGAVIYAALQYADPETGAKPVHSVALEEWGGATPLEGNVALRVYVEDGTGTATTDLVEALQRMYDGADTQDLPGGRAGGVPTLVVAATPANIDVSVALDIEAGKNVDELQLAVETEISRYLRSLPVSGQKVTGEAQGVVPKSQLYKAVMNVCGVFRATFGTPATNVILSPGMKAMPGTITVTIASVT